MSLCFNFGMRRRRDPTRRCDSLASQQAQLALSGHPAAWATAGDAKMFRDAQDETPT
jgi:hypothetical protein